MKQRLDKVWRSVRGRWSVSLSICLATTFTAVAVSTLLVTMSDEQTEVAVERAVGPHVGVQCRLLALAVTDRSVEALEVHRRNAQAEAVALFDPEGQRRRFTGSWRSLPDAQEILAHLQGNGVGRAYELEDGPVEQVFQTAYARLPDGWILGLETEVDVEVVEQLELQQFLVSAVAVAFSAVLGLVLGVIVSGPLRRLERQVSKVSPGDPPQVVTTAGPRETRAVGEAVRGLLQAIRERDQTVARIHLQEIDQLMRMSAEVAHEVRNPLHALTLSIGRLASVEDEASRLKIANRVNEQLEHLEVIVQRLLNLTRPIHVKSSRVELVDLAGRLVVDGDPRVQVESEGPIWLDTDPVLVTEVLQNLVRNAAEAGAKNVTITLRDGVECKVTVRDDGPGIDDEQVPHLFDWFHTTRAQGSGLGLPTSRRMATAVGGRLSCTLQQPATFQLDLPRER